MDLNNKENKDTKNKSNKKYRRTLNGSFNETKRSAKRRDLDFTITEEQWKGLLLKKPCFY